MDLGAVGVWLGPRVLAAGVAEGVTEGAGTGAGAGGALQLGMACCEAADEPKGVPMGGATAARFGSCSVDCWPSCGGAGMWPEVDGAGDGGAAVE